MVRFEDVMTSNEEMRVFYMRDGTEFWEEGWKGWKRDTLG